MTVRLHPHALARMAERGAAPEEVEATVTGGERYPARFGRTGFRRNFAFGGDWRGRRATGCHHHRQRPQAHAH